MNYIFRVEEGTSERIQSVSFSEMGIEERSDLEKWMLQARKSSMRNLPNPSRSVSRTFSFEP